MDNEASESSENATDKQDDFLRARRDAEVLTAGFVASDEQPDEQAEQAAAEIEEIDFSKPARGVVWLMQLYYGLFLPGFKYEEEIYQEAERRLPPLLRKLAEFRFLRPLFVNPVTKNSSEADGAVFLGGLYIKTWQQVKTVNAANDDKGGTNQQAAEGDIGGNQSGRFTI